MSGKNTKGVQLSLRKNHTQMCMKKLLSVRNNDENARFIIEIIKFLAL